MQSQINTKKLTSSALIASLALIMSYVEFLIPMPFPIPGIKLGIANLAILIALYKLGPSYALPINLLRIAIAGLLFTGLFSTLYAASGALLSFVVMIFLKNTDKFSIVGVSMAGSVAHNLGQLLIASFIMSTPHLLYYFPVLLFSGMLTGILIGICAYELLKKLVKAF
ncbi:MAG: Gx transporter family protein [Eubacteriales bacterium]